MDTPKGRPGFDQHGGISLDGMVCAWWFDGNRMFEPYIKKKCRMIVVDDKHQKRGQVIQVTQALVVGKAVIPLTKEDMSMGSKRLE